MWAPWGWILYFRLDQDFEEASTWNCAPKQKRCTLVAFAHSNRMRWTRSGELVHASPP